MFDNFDKQFRRLGILAIIGGVVSLLVSLGLLGLIGWAIVMLVNHFAG